MVQGNTGISINLSIFCRMDLENECLANNFDNEEGDDDKIWQKAFYVFQNFMDGE